MSAAQVVPLIYKDCPLVPNQNDGISCGIHDSPFISALNLGGERQTDLPCEQMRQLLDKGPERIMARVLERKTFPCPLWFRVLASRNRLRLGVDIAESDDLPPEWQFILAGDKGHWSVRERVAKRADLLPEVEKILVVDESPYVRAAVLARGDSLAQQALAGNHDAAVQLLRERTSIPSEWQQELVYSKAEQVRCELAKIDNLSQEAQVTLAADHELAVRCAIAGSRSLVPKMQRRLAHDKNRKVRCYIARRCDLRPQLQNALARDTSGHVRAALAERDDLMEDLREYLWRDPDVKVRWAMGQRQDLCSVELRAKRDSVGHPAKAFWGNQEEVGLEAEGVGQEIGL